MSLKINIGHSDDETKEERHSVEGPLNSLPIEMLTQIFSFLASTDVFMRVFVVNKYFRNIILNSRILWITKYLDQTGPYYDLVGNVKGRTFPKIVQKLTKNTSLDEVKNLVKRIGHLKVFMWGNNSRGILGTGNQGEEDYSSELVEPLFPKHERIWFLSHTHETNALAISLSGKMYAWAGGEPPFQSQVKKEIEKTSTSEEDILKSLEQLEDSILNPFSGKTEGDRMFDVPKECVVFNRHMQKNGEVPIRVCCGHRLGAVLTSGGNVYYSRGMSNDVLWEDEGEVDEDEKKNENLGFKKWRDGVAWIGTSGFKIIAISPSKLVSKFDVFGGGRRDDDDDPQHLEEKIPLEKDEEIVEMFDCYDECNLVVVTNKMRAFSFLKEESNCLCHVPSWGDVVDYSTTESHTMFCNSNGDVFGRGRNGFGQVHPNTEVEYFKKETKVDFSDTVLENKKVVRVSCGCDFSRGGHTLLQVEENGDLYHLGINKRGEHLKYPKDSDVHKPVKVPIPEDRTVLTFEACENYCWVITTKIVTRD